MKIVCNNCSTNYSIADEKVVGGVFQTPCKRCGSTMVIHGPQARSTTPDALRSERNENSLLFALNDLAAMVDVPSAACEPKNTRTEGSGLLDIRSMASAYHGDNQAQSENPSFIDNIIPTISATPVLLDPMVSVSRSSKNPIIWLVGGATGMAAIATVVVAVMFLKGGSGQAAQASTAQPDPLAGGQLVAVAITPDTSASSLPEVVKPEVVKPEVVKPEVVEPQPARSERSRPSPRKSEPKRREPKKTEEPEVKPPPKKGCLDEVGCLLASNPPACCRKYTSNEKAAEPKVKTTPDSTLPSQLARGDIKTSMKKVLGRVMACGSRSTASGKVTISIKVAGDGSVKSTTVKESPNNALGSCVADAVSKAKFPETQKGGSFSYPFMF